MEKIKPSFWALSPLLVFLVLYLVTSLLINDFYKVPISVAFIISSVYAVCITRRKKFSERVALFSEGASNPNVMLMIWIFILAGAFAKSAEAMGAIEATVNATLHFLPGELLLAGMFVAACFISMSVGTSVGTVVALVPVAVGLAARTGTEIPYMVAIVVGGAFFGDNLSFISDTTIASTRTQGCELRDKFIVNSRIVFPVAVVMLVYYMLAGVQVDTVDAPPVDWIRILPYILVLATAIAGMNVMKVLTLGILSAGIIGIADGVIDVFGWFGAMGEGVSAMGGLIIITLLAGGMLELIRYNGGIDYIINLLTRHVSGKRGAEFSIAALVGIANICTANNTIAIITVGPIARNISGKFGLDSRKVASLLDTFSCVVQGIIPYGAQLLMASGLAIVSPLSIIRYLYYPLVLALFAILAILFRYPRKYS
ncbi:Na+/H+ antiporter NhaC family protein [Barnesiella propionica]|uniref:Na+/H+ antiporter NhaC family protein n=1 Tax=Barnesiella propionica TaxID=2981781 RepID=UPI0011C80A24|nr:Na+/H+ antiporter NhaC family protein [Barnesiella propionica]MCU6769145.1 Na+/H+ antiporter NhaC family protein [Barnesiella propionica]